MNRRNARARMAPMLSGWTCCRLCWPRCGQSTRRRNGGHDGQQRQRDFNRILIIQSNAGDVATGNLEGVEQVDGAERKPERQPQKSDGERFDPHGAPDLLPYGSDGLKNAQLATPVCDRHRQRIDDSENRHQDRHGDLHISQAEPLVRQSENVTPDFMRLFPPFYRNN